MERKILKIDGGKKTRRKAGEKLKTLSRGRRKFENNILGKILEMRS